MNVIQWPIFLLENALTEGLIEGSIIERMDAGSRAGSAAAFKIDRRNGRLAGLDSVVLEELNGEMRDLCQPFWAVICITEVGKVGAVHRVVLGLVPKYPQGHFLKGGGRHFTNLTAQILPVFRQTAVAC